MIRLGLSISTADSRMYPQRRPESGNFRARRQGNLSSSWALEPRCLPAAPVLPALTTLAIDRTAFATQLKEQFNGDVSYLLQPSGTATQFPEAQAANAAIQQDINNFGLTELYLNEPAGAGDETLLNGAPWMPVVDRLILNGQLSNGDLTDVYALSVSPDEDSLRFVLTAPGGVGPVPALTVWDANGKALYHWAAPTENSSLEVEFSLPQDVKESLKESSWVYVGVSLPDRDKQSPDPANSPPPPLGDQDGDGNDSETKLDSPIFYNLMVERGGGKSHSPGGTSEYGGSGKGPGAELRIGQGGASNSPNGSRDVSLLDEAEGRIARAGPGTGTGKAETEPGAGETDAGGAVGRAFVPSGSGRQLTTSGFGAGTQNNPLANSSFDTAELASIDLDSIAPEVMAAMLASQSGPSSFDEGIANAGGIVPLTTTPLLATATLSRSEADAGATGELTGNVLNNQALISYAIAALIPSRDLEEGELIDARPSRLVTLGLPSLGFAAALAYGFFYPTIVGSRPGRSRRSGRDRGASVSPNCTPYESR